MIRDPIAFRGSISASPKVPHSDSPLSIQIVAMTEGHPEELPEPFELQEIPHDLRQYLPYPKSWEALGKINIYHFHFIRCFYVFHHIFLVDRIVVKVFRKLFLQIRTLL